MPKTTFQRVVFTVMMVFCMVFCMTVYSLAIQGGALQAQTFALAIREMWVEFAFVFLLVFFAVSPLALRMAFRLVDPKAVPPILVTLSIQCCTVVCVVPAVTLFATILHGGAAGGWFCRWITTAALCFPAALLLQIFFIGPLVRALFALLFPQRV